MTSTLTRTSSTFAPTMFTFRDAIYACADYQRGNASAKVETDVLMAVMAAYREIPGMHAWRYLIRQGHINLNAPYDTGTIAYDHTGGSSERMVTLTTGTWPTWAANAQIRIASVVYPVEARVSNSVITLDANINPGADISSGTEYTIYQSGYVLPQDFVSMYAPITTTSWYGMRYLPPDRWLQLDRVSYSAGEAVFWTLLGSNDSYGLMRMEVWPSPDDDIPLQFLYNARPRPLVANGTASKYSVGTVSISGTAVTGSSTTFDSSMVGSVIRVSSDATTIPTGAEGDNPFVDERTIVSYTSATSVTLDAAGTTASGKKYVISDPIDIYPHMTEAFLACCRFKLGQRRRAKELESLRNDYYAELRKAKEQDAMVPIGPPAATPMRAFGWATPLGADNS